MAQATFSCHTSYAPRNTDHAHPERVRLKCAEAEERDDFTDLLTLGSSDESLT